MFIVMDDLIQASLKPQQVDFLTGVKLMETNYCLEDSNQNYCSKVVRTVSLQKRMILLKV